MEVFPLRPKPLIFLLLSYTSLVNLLNIFKSTLYYQTSETTYISILTYENSRLIFHFNCSKTLPDQYLTYNLKIWYPMNSHPYS